VIVVALTVAIVASLMNPLPADEDVDVEVDQASNEGRAIVAGSVVQDGQVDKCDDVRVDPGPDSAASHGLDERTIQPTRG
jgi:hypothetical protein